MLRDLLIDKDLFGELREKALKDEEAKSKMEAREKAVLKKLRKKRSTKKLKKMGISKEDLKEIVELADIVGLDLLGGGLQIIRLQKNILNGASIVELAVRNHHQYLFIVMK